MDEAFEVEVNRVAHTVHCGRDTPLLYVLRNHLGLMGTRFGCGTGLCGACFVLLDGHPTPSCDTPVWAAAGRRVTTVEGLADGDTLHPLQEAFLAERAAQCGYCVSGVLISAAALLRDRPTPTADDVKGALDRNLCRCGAHNRMVRAVLRAAAGDAS